eukprot:CAMPEP_0171348064 /NCGR_PEP_ID=MMETSP0878-20121228/29789_1 /TAXON_ID=67004 /ORGANISM="Thalassiosira weissflogii, Strain CCMP1336" /LENGTH=268 /DNA_ID=CAMNT_0011852291 /DNA_START=409 /DNA_END=1215 /DNA_ORIENTATION=-
MIDTTRKNKSKLSHNYFLSSREEESVVCKESLVNRVNRHKSYVNAVDGIVEDIIRNEHDDQEMSVLEWISGSMCNDNICARNPYDDMVAEERGDVEDSPHTEIHGGQNKDEYLNKAVIARAKRHTYTNPKSEILIPGVEPLVALAKVGGSVVETASSAEYAIIHTYDGLIRTFQDVIEVTNKRIDAIDTALGAVCGIEPGDNTTWLSKSFTNRRRVLLDQEQSLRRNNGETVVETLVKSGWTAIVDAREKELKCSASDFSSRDGLHSL